MFYPQLIQPWHHHKTTEASRIEKDLAAPLSPTDIIKGQFPVKIGRTNFFPAAAIRIWIGCGCGFSIEKAMCENK